jgi:hypothetical protein
MKAVSQFIATIILMISTISIGIFAYSWYRSTFYYQSQQISQTSEKYIYCSHASIRILRENSYCDSFGNISFYIENSGKVKLYDLFVDIFSEQYIGSFKIYDKYGNEIKEIDPNKILRVFVKVNESKKSYTIKIRNNCNVESSLTIKCNWLEGWFYRIPILINNTASSNLQNVEINLDSLTLISDAKLRRDCSDIRFTDSDGITLLNYNISNCNSESTKIWVNITIPTNSNKTIYLYYGNPSANFPVYYNITPVPQTSISIVFSKAWLSGFQYRKPILINNTLNSNNLNDYQILVTNPIYNETGLVLSYHFNEGSGTIAYDSSGNNNHGILYSGSNVCSNPPTSGCPTWVDGKFGKALQFDGIDDYVLLPRVVQDDFTITFWFKSTQVAGGESQWWQGMGLVDAEVSGVVNDFGISLGNGKILFGTGNPDVTIKSGFVADGKWHFVAARRIRATGALSLFIDGSLVATGIGGTQSLTASPYIRIGSLQTNTNFFKGIIDEVRIYNRALSDDEILALYQAKARLDYGDIRFTDENNNLLNYWQEADGRFWVKVPNIPPNSIKTIYLYYGNPNATSLSNASNVFIPNQIYVMSGSCTDATYCGYMDNHNEANVIRTYPPNICTKYVDKIDWGSVCDNSAFPSSVRDYFYSRFRFLFIADVSGTYTFGIDSDDGSEAMYSPTDRYGYYGRESSSGYSGESVIVSWYGGHGVANSLTAYTGTINLVAGQGIWIDVVQEDWTGSEGIRLGIQKPGGSMLIVSAANFPNQIFARKYTYPEPTISLGAEQSLSNILEQTYYSY